MKIAIAGSRTIDNIDISLYIPQNATLIISGGAKGIDALAEELEGKVKFGKVDVDEEAALSLKYGIMNIPTLVVMNKGEFQNKAVGLQDRDGILALLNL